MATSVPVPMAEAEVGLGERRGVVDAVADHRHDASLGLEPADHLGLVGRGLTSAMTSSMPTSCGDGAGRGLVVAGQEHRAQTERLERGDSFGGAVPLTVSATTNTCGRLSVPAGGDGGLPAGLGGPAGRVELGAQAHGGGDPNPERSAGRPTISA